MTRKEFIATLALSMASLTGLPALLGILSGQHLGSTKDGSDYGGSDYGV